MWRLFIAFHWNPFNFCGAGMAEISQERSTGVAPAKKAYRHLTVSLWFVGADDVNRTHDPHITNVLLYRLSYIGINQILYSEIRCLATSLSSRGAIKSDANELCGTWNYVGSGRLALPAYVLAGQALHSSITLNRTVHPVRIAYLGFG